MALQGTKTSTSTLGQLLGQGGSDHSKQGAEFQEGALILRGLTHNTLNQGHDKDNCPVTGKSFSNNPYDIQEDNTDYLNRKKNQLNSYIKNIKDAIEAKKPLDFIFLQEVDVFSNTRLDVNKKNLLDSFNAQLKALNWGFTTTNHELDCKPMVTLYSKDTFSKVVSKKGLMKDSRNSKNTAFETVFKHSCGKHIALTNVHLDYDKNPTDCYNDIKKYQAAQIGNGILTIIGGDTNHPREEFQGLALGDGHFPTSFDLDRNTNTLSSLHRLTGLQNAIDSFFVSPSSKSAVVTGCQILSEYVDENYKIKLIPQERLQTYQSSAPGKPASSSAQGPISRHEGVSLYTSSFASHSAQAQPVDDGGFNSEQAHAHFTNEGTNGDFNLSLRSRLPSLCSSSDDNTETSSSNGLFFSNIKGSESSSIRNTLSNQPNCNDLSQACMFLSNTIKLGKHIVRFEKESNTFVVAIKHNVKGNDVGMTESNANDALATLAEQCLSHLGIGQANGRRVNIEPFVFNHDKYRCIHLTKDQAQLLIDRYKSILVPESSKGKTAVLR